MPRRKGQESVKETRLKQQILRFTTAGQFLDGALVLSTARARRKRNIFTSLEHFSIKHDLARSCFKFWLKIGDEGDKISRKKTGEALAETVFSRNFVTLGADFEGHN